MKFDMGAVLVHYGAAPTTPRTGWTPVKCPFHDDRNASAAYHNGEGKFHCFVCGIHEDAVGLVMSRDGLDFQDAVRTVETITGQGAGEICREPQLGGWFPQRQGNPRTVGGQMGAWRRNLANAGVFA